MKQLIFRKSRKSQARGRFLSFSTLLLAVVGIALGMLIKSTLISIVFLSFLGLGIYLIVKSYNFRETVIVNEDGIISNVNSVGVVDWAFIEGFEIKKAANTEILVIYINDSEKLLSTKNKLVSKLMQSNIKSLGSPVIIPQSEFHKPLSTVKEEIEMYRRDLL